VLGDRRADPLRGSGDDGDFALELLILWHVAAPFLSRAVSPNQDGCETGSMGPCPNLCY
jgi:hypothetical protein